MSSVFDAAYMAAHEYQGGVPALALRMSTPDKRVNPSVLAHQLNPNDEANHLTVRTLNRVIALTGDHSPVHAFCIDHGYMALPIPSTSDEIATDAITDTVKEFSDFLQAVTQTLADGKVTKLELRRVRKELSELIAKGGKLEAILAAKEAKRGRT